MTRATYNTDLYAWTQAQAEALRTKDWPALDLDHLAQEIDSLGRNDRRAIAHQLERLLLHLLKRIHQPDQQTRLGRSWRRSVRQARNATIDLIEESPSLYDYPAQHLALAYQRARRQVNEQTELPLSTFPETCPWAFDQLLDEDWWPEEEE